MTYELLDHPSEIGFRAAGVSLESAFEDAGKAVFEIMTDIDGLEAAKTVSFEVESENLDALLFDFVDELIYLSQVDNLLLCAFDIGIEPVTAGYRLTCKAEGQKIGDGMRLQEIKAPTYSDILVEHEDDSWTLQMFVDV